MKKASIIIALLFFLPMIAQKQKATLYFRDGTTQTGLAKLFDLSNFGGKIKFRKDKNSNKIIYTSLEIDKISIRENDIYVIYQYKIVENKGTIVLLELIAKGKVTLYRDQTQGYYSSGTRMGGGFNSSGVGMGRSYSINNYYVSKDNKNVSHLGSKGTLFSKNFKKSASEYFKDCSELVNKIQSKEFKKRNIVDIVEFYNENCN